MATANIYNRGRGPEIEGTRITIQDLMPEFTNPDMTEASICERYDLEPEQVAAARAYAFSHADIELGKYLEFETRPTPENPPEVVERMERAHVAMMRFKEWLAQRESSEVQVPSEAATESERETKVARNFATFKEWLALEDSRSAVGP